MQNLLAATFCLVVVLLLVALVAVIDYTLPERDAPATAAPQDHNTCEYPVDEITALNIRIQRLEDAQ